MSQSREKEPSTTKKRSEYEPSSLEEFREKYMGNSRDVNIFLKSKRYARLGLYLSGFLLYLVLAFYLSNEVAVTSLPFIGVAVIATLSSLFTILLYLNKRRYGFTQEDLTYHEVAALIDLYQGNPKKDEIDPQLERFEEIVLEDNPTLPKVWKDELEYYFSHIDESDPEVFTSTFEDVGFPLINTLDRFQNLDLGYVFTSEEESKSSENSNPNFFEVISDSLDSDYISKGNALWLVFIIAAVAGLGLAFLKGQGWGVLLVTIVFAGLRLYDSQTD